MAAENTAFTASGEDAITRAIDIQPDTTADALPQSDFDDFYEITRTAEEIIHGDYKRIALQFPDELLHDSVPIYRRLKAKIGEGRELYVLADTSYGSCCVDEVAAQHVDAHAVVHYGHACLTQTSRLPVIYVFGHKPFDVSACVTSVLIFLTQHVENLGREEGARGVNAILLKHEVGYTHAADNLHHILQDAFKPLGIKILYERIATSSLPASSSHPRPTPAETPAVNQPPQSQPEPHAKPHPEPSEEGSPVESASSNTVLLYIGGESLTLTNLLMTHGLSEVFAYDPTTGATRLASGHTNRLLMRRYAAVQRARDADVFGILVGTLGVASYLPLIRHLRALLSRNRKKSYTISVGKLNPAKLANFLEIECFVLVACPENSIIEAKEFLRPIVTPFELEVALRASQSWTGRYVLDFERLLAEAPRLDSESAEDQTAEADRADEDTDGDDPDRPVFSLITGTYRHAKRYDAGADSQPVESASGSEVVLRNQDSAVATLTDSAAGMFLQARSYQGLEAHVGEDPPSVLEQGRSGIARGYRDVDHKPLESESS